LTSKEGIWLSTELSCCCNFVSNRKELNSCAKSAAENKQQNTMRNWKKMGLYSLMSVSLLSACSTDDDDDAQTPSSSTAKLSLAINGLEDLGDQYRYEGWIIVDGAAISAGLFDVDANGDLSETSFNLAASDLSAASAYVLTIEPSPDPDPAPSAVHILAGDFDNMNAPLNTSHAAAIGTDFTAATGSYILATPTDGGSMSDELSGLWWLDPAAGPGPGLSLPSLPNGWIYEGWAVINGEVLSTGTFSTASGSDGSANFSGTMAGPPFPGEDFLQNAPAGLSFPTNLSGATVVVSVEPVPDNSSAPFALKPLVATVPAAAADHTPYNMNNNATNSNPSGVATR
jgi:hypothetical protein